MRKRQIIVAKVATVRPLRQHLLLSLFALLEDLSCRMESITQTYTKSSTSLEKESYIKTPIEMDPVSEKLFMAVERLYGIHVSELRRLLTPLEHPTARPGISWPCSLIYLLNIWSDRG